MQEEIIGTEEIYDGRIVKLAVHDVRLPDGSTAKRELVRHPGAVAMVALDEAQNILLVRQYRIGAGKALLEIPAGTLEPDESPIDCARRELREETGYSPAKLESLGGAYMVPGYSTEYIHLFLATDLTHNPAEADADEFIEVERMPLATALNHIETGEIADAKTITAVLRIVRRLGI